VTWQDAGVAIVVAGAVYYLWRKLFKPARRRPASFVPLSSLKRRR
jgi:hypothetical protein